MNWTSATRRTARVPLQVAMMTVGGVVLLATALLTLGVGPFGSRGGTTAASRGSAIASAAEPEVHYHPGRPAHIHAGTCDNLGDVAFPLNPVGAGEMSGAAMEGIAAMSVGDAPGSSPSTPVEIGKIALDTPLAEIAAGSYALNVQISEFDYGNDIACGDLGGIVRNGALAFGLRERNGSGFSGLTLLKADGDETAVTVFLIGGDGVTGS